MRLICAFLFLSAGLSIHAQESHVTASLIANKESIQKGEPFLLAIKLNMRDHWHTYWENPGFSGLPTTLDLEEVAGLEIGPLQFAWPKRFADDEGFVTYGYDDETLIMAEATYTGDASSIAIKGKINWLECKTLCIPGDEDADLKLNVGNAKSANEDLFKKYLALMPKPYNGDMPFTFTSRYSFEPEAWKGTVTFMGKDGALSKEAITLFPLKNDEGELKTTEANEDNGSVTLKLSYEAWEEVEPKHIGGVVKIDTPDGPVVARLNLHGAPAQTASSNSIPTETDEAAVTEIQGTDRSMLYILLLAFIGGMILNLMPCVLPVISLKVYSLINEAGESSLRRIQLGWAYTIGIMVTFLVFSLFFVTAKVAGEQAGIGFQLSNPYFVIPMVVLLFVMSLSFFGIFEIGAPDSGKLHNLSQKSGFTGAFFLGVLTTILSTPCTAPGLGAAYGWALSQSSLMLIFIFQVIALGLAFPYLLLVHFPALLRFLPKPGQWMLHFKITMGFMMMGATIWLLGVLEGLTGMQGVLGVLALCLLLGQAAYIIGNSWHTGNRIKGLVSALVIGALGYWVGMHAIFDIQNPYIYKEEEENQARLAALADLQSSGAEINVFAMLEEQVTTEDRIAWVPYSPENLGYFRAKNRLVFLDFTADWCITCKANEKGVIDTAKIRKLFAENNVVVMRGDYTRMEAEHTEFIKSFGRAGVPLYVVYPGEGAHILLPEAITPGMVTRAVEDAQIRLTQSASKE